MIPEDDVAYCLQREAEERVAAAAATDPAVKDIHFELADRYADRAWGLEEARYYADARKKGG